MNKVNDFEPMLSIRFCSGNPIMSRHGAEHPPPGTIRVNQLVNRKMSKLLSE